ARMAGISLRCLFFGFTFVERRDKNCRRDIIAANLTGARMPVGESGDTMKHILKLTAAAALVAAGLTGAAQAQDKVTFATNWLAQAEHGGYYQAVADG